MHSVQIFFLSRVFSESHHIFPFFIFSLFFSQKPHMTESSSHRRSVSLLLLKDEKDFACHSLVLTHPYQSSEKQRSRRRAWQCRAAGESVAPLLIQLLLTSWSLLATEEIVGEKEGQVSRAAVGERRRGEKRHLPRTKRERGPIHFVWSVCALKYAYGPSHAERPRGTKETKGEYVTTPMLRESSFYKRSGEIVWEGGET